MDFRDWEPHYREILEYFGFDRAADEEAARLLASLMTRDNLLSLAALTYDNEVTVCGKRVTVDAIDVKKRIGVLPEDLGLFEDLSIDEHLRLTAFDRGGGLADGEPA